MSDVMVPCCRYCLREIPKSDFEFFGEVSTVKIMHCKECIFKCADGEIDLDHFEKRSIWEHL